MPPHPIFVEFHGASVVVYAPTHSHGVSVGRSWMFTVNSCCMRFHRVVETSWTSMVLPWRFHDASILHGVSMVLPWNLH